MLESLDTLIAFTVIMTVTSLFITVLVQVAGMLLNLRGRNLLSGVKAAFNAIDPKVLQSAPLLGDYLLTRPTISDHTSIFGHRLTEDAAERAKFAKKSWWWRPVRRLAGAVKPDELFTAIHQLAHPAGGADATANPDALQQQALALLEALGFDGQKAAAWQQFLEKKQQTVASIAELDKTLVGLPEGELKKSLQAKREGVAADLNALLQQATAGVATMASGVEAAYEKFNYWFESTQTRAIQWFTMHTRWATIFFAVVIALYFQLDAVDIFRKVSGDQALRAKLVGSAKLVSEQAEGILAKSPEVIDTAWKAWRADPAVQAWLADKEARLDDAYAALESAQRSESVVTSLVEKHMGRSAATLQHLATFSEKIGQEVGKRVDTATQQSEELLATLEKSGFDLIPKGSRWPKEGRKPHLAGMLLSVALLSLGAPFWFNSLRTMTNLRSKLANDIEEETKPDGPADIARKSQPSRPALPPAIH